jgi:hypothetical protein
VFQKLRDIGFEIALLSHAKAILEADFPAARDELETVLSSVTIPIAEIIASGGGEAKGTQRLRRSLAQHGWRKGFFEITKTINGIARESKTHEIDHIRESGTQGIVALEIEWNNKDPFFDRDLENFKRLHSEGAISVGVIVTRGSTLQDQMWDLVRKFADTGRISSFADLESIGVFPTRRQRQNVLTRVDREKNPISFADAWTDAFVADKYGAATTHWRKLIERIDRGVGHPCPLVLVGLPARVVTFSEDDLQLSGLANDE